MPKEAELDDLLTIIRDSPQYREMRDRLLSEIPTDARYICQLEDLRLAAITFTLAKEKTFIPNHFILAPAVVYYVDHISRRIVEIVIRQINEETLDEVQLTFLSTRKSKTIKLEKSVTEMLKTTKQTVSTAAKGGKTLICWLVTKPGTVNRTCKNICMAGCISVCAGVTRWLRGPCAVGCNELCDAMCAEGTLDVECSIWDEEFTPT